jgi:hypothetical protein
MKARPTASEPVGHEVDETCWPCGSAGDDGRLERQPGWCSSCGFFFDHYGMQIFEPWLTCPVHTELRSMCPHPAVYEIRRP